MPLKKLVTSDSKWSVLPVDPMLRVWRQFCQAAPSEDGSGVQGGALGVVGVDKKTPNGKP